MQYLKKSFVYLGTLTLTTAMAVTNAQAGIFDNINQVLDTVDRANNTVDRAENSANRTAQRFPSTNNNAKKNQPVYPNTIPTGVQDSKQFSSMGTSVGMSISSYSVRIQSPITITFEAPNYFKKDAWIGIVPSNIQHGSEALNDKHDTTYQYLNQKTSGTISLIAPSVAGSYDIRMHDTDSNGREVASISIYVTQ